VAVINPKRITIAMQVNGTLSSHAVAPAAASSSKPITAMAPLLLLLLPPLMVAVQQ
jgi:hypothetical protein